MCVEMKSPEVTHERTFVLSDNNQNVHVERMNQKCTIKVELSQSYDGWLPAAHRTDRI
jgi:hypothetical protein